MLSSSEMIILEGDKAQVVSLVVQKTMYASEFIKNIDIKKDSYDTPLLPRDTIFYKVKQSKAAYVIEGRPRVCSFKSQAHLDMTFQVPIPWHVFIAFVDLNQNTIRPSYMFFTPGPIRSLDDRLYATWLGNQYHDRDGSLCLGHDTATDTIEIGTANVSLRQRLQMLSSHVYNSSFNDSLSIPINNVPPELSGVDSAKLGNEQLNKTYYSLAAGSETTYKWMAKSHLWFMRNQQLSEMQIGEEVSQWRMREISSLSQFLTKRFGSNY